LPTSVLDEDRTTEDDRLSWCEWVDTLAGRYPNAANLSEEAGWSRKRLPSWKENSNNFAARKLRVTSGP
jgi:hypothetical protein